MKVNREEFLKTLQLVQPGVSRKEEIEQSSFFLFKGGRVLTYNEEIACRYPCDIGLEGAVKAIPLLGVLEKMTEDELDIEATKREFLIKGKGRRLGIRFEKEINNEIDKVKLPAEWKLLPKDFSEAVDLVRQACSDNPSHFASYCIHITPTFIEGYDMAQAARYPIDLPVESELLVKHIALKHLVGMEMTKFGETDAFLHFKRPDRLIISCRKYIEDYADLEKMYKITNARKAKLPMGLIQAVEKAEIFADDGIYEGAVLVELRPGDSKKKGRLMLQGIGSLGWYKEPKRIEYSDEPLQFLITPKMLKEIVQKNMEVLIAPKKMKVEAKRWSYVTALGVPNEKEDSDDEAEEVE